MPSLSNKASASWQVDRPRYQGQGWTGDRVAEGHRQRLMLVDCVGGRQQWGETWGPWWDRAGAPNSAQSGREGKLGSFQEETFKVRAEE